MEIWVDVQNIITEREKKHDKELYIQYDIIHRN